MRLSKDHRGNTAWNTILPHRIWTFIPKPRNSNYIGDMVRKKYILMKIQLKEQLIGHLLLTKLFA